jgi:hypothetical protein
MPCSRMSLLYNQAGLHSLPSAVCLSEQRPQCVPLLAELYEYNLVLGLAHESDRLCVDRGLLPPLLDACGPSCIPDKD